MRRVGVNTPDLPAVAGNGFSQLRQPRRGAIMGVAFLQGFDSRFYDMFRGIEVRFPNFQVDYFLALGLQGPGFG